MEQKQFLRAEDIRQLTGRSESYCYGIIRTLNKELKEQGYLTLSGQVPTTYFYARYMPEIEVQK